MKKGFNPIIYIMFTAALALVSCGSSYYSSCIDDAMQQMQIGWGDHDINSGSIDGYILKTDGSLFKVERDSTGAATKTEKIGTIDEDKYCSIYRMTAREVMKTQTLNSAIDIERYVFMKNIPTGLNFRASWNPKYDTYGSKGFRQVFDSLQALVNMAEE